MTPFMEAFIEALLAFIGFPILFIGMGILLTPLVLYMMKLERNWHRKHTPRHYTKARYR